ncbi:MAG: hypothetical protein OEQ12_02680, partial [Nitrosopumilus sp.]|nr:hypothetical protein [Nitrosopumilus sp.]
NKERVNKIENPKKPIKTIEKRDYRIQQTKTNPRESRFTNKKPKKENKRGSGKDKKTDQRKNKED